MRPGGWADVKLGAVRSGQLAPQAATTASPVVRAVATEQLVSSTFTGFAAWISERAERPIADDEAAALAAFGLGSLLSSRLLRDVLGISAQVDDQTLIGTWVQIMAATLADPVAFRSMTLKRATLAGATAFITVNRSGRAAPCWHYGSAPRSWASRL